MAIPAELCSLPSGAEGDVPTRGVRESISVTAFHFHSCSSIGDKIQGWTVAHGRFTCRIARRDLNFLHLSNDGGEDERVVTGHRRRGAVDGKPDRIRSRKEYQADGGVLFVQRHSGHDILDERHFMRTGAHDYVSA
jgi:hypothetical protein